MGKWVRANSGKLINHVTLARISLLPIAALKKNTLKVGKAKQLNRKLNGVPHDEVYTIM